MKAQVINLGCKVNRVESDEFTAELSECGWRYSGESMTDLVIINSCTVTAEAAKKTRKTIRGALRKNPEARVVVVGCAAAIDREELLSLGDRVEVCSKDEALEIIRSFKQGHAISRPLRVGERFPTRVAIKVQDGCNNACTFCIVHKARGRSKSRDFDEVLAEVMRYSEADVAEVVLTGINLGSYRSDQKGLYDLLEALLCQTRKTRYRLSSIEPKDVGEKLIDLIARSDGRICRHLHIPLQSGSSPVLAEMNRNYDARYFGELVSSLYEKMPSFSLSTDIIVGFPGETEEDFEQTLSMVQRCRFSKVHIFPYSKRTSTPAAIRNDQIPPEVVSERVKILTEIATELRSSDYERRRGTAEVAVVEEKGKAMTESYFHIDVSNDLVPGTAVEIFLP